SVDQYIRCAASLSPGYKTAVIEVAMKPKRMMSYHSRALPSPAAKTAFLTRALSALDSTADALIAHLFTVSEDACAFARHPDRRDPAGTRIYQLMSLTRGPHCAYGRLIRWPRLRRLLAAVQAPGDRGAGPRRPRLRPPPRRPRRTPRAR